MKLLFAILIMLIFLVMCLASLGGELSPEFLRALHQVEASGRFGPIVGDNGQALGPFQIHRAYWQASGVAGTYEQCADYDYSVKVVTGYLTRYGSSFMRARAYEPLARIHNGGPRGHKKKSTKKYWLKVKKYLTSEKP